jgi:hypothetical protein
MHPFAEKLSADGNRDKGDKGDKGDKRAAAHFSVNAPLIKVTFQRRPL